MNRMGEQVMAVAPHRGDQYAAAMTPLLRTTAGLLVVLIALTGCANQDKVTDDQIVVTGWPYWPTEIRVHPLSRLVIDPIAETTVIEARIELCDADGFTCRGCGQLRVDLAPLAVDGDTQPVATWNLNLNNLVFNRERYDAVTRTYLFRLELDAETELPQPAELRAYYMRGDGLPLRQQRLRLATAPSK